MIPASGSGGIMQETSLIPAVSTPDYNGTGRKIYGRWKQYFHRNFHVLEPLAAEYFPLPERKQNCQYLTEKP
jgi:hypothetical protein